MESIKKIVLVLLFFSSFIFSQEHIGIHQRDAEKYGLKVKLLSKFDPSGKGIIPLKTSSVKQLSKAVFGYLPDWEYPDAKNNLRYDLLTHIAAFDFNVSNNGFISNPSGWPWTDIINAAHSNGVKVVMVAVNFNKDDIRNIITNNSVTNNFINNVISKINQYNLDGVNIDFEGLYTDDRGSRINNFMKALSDSVHANLPGKEVSFAAPAVNWGNHWNLSGLAASCDYLFIMGYDFYGSWSSNTGPTAPLTGDSYNVTNTVLTQYASVTQNNPEKLILGVPYYGIHFKASSSAENAPVTEFVESPRYRSTVSLISLYGRKWSTKYKTPWLAWNDGVWHQLWYDDDSSLGLKYDLAITHNLKGVGMWALNYDGTRNELWNELDIKFGTGTLPAPNTPEEFRVVSESDSSLRIQFSEPAYATGYKLFIGKDGINFNPPYTVTSNNILIEGLSPDTTYYFKVQAFNDTGASDDTEVLAGIPSSAKSILVVNGFDRISGTNNTRNLIRQYANPILMNGFKFVSSSNEAVYNGKVKISDYPIVIWMLGDESTVDETFNSVEQDTVENYLKSGGKLLVSGSEVGWDLVAKGSANDKSFYHNYLKADYIDDAPNGQKATYYSVDPVSGSMFSDLSTTKFDNGNHGTFDVDWPDAIKSKNGSENVLQYAGVPLSNGGAGISYNGIFPGGSENAKLVYLAVPFETFYPESSRIDIMKDILNFFELPVSVDEQGKVVKNNFVLYQNYPNPFNPSTTIKFYITHSGNINLQIFNSLGQLVWSKILQGVAPGQHKVVWYGINNSGGKVSSGNYIYRLIFTDFSGNVMLKSGKMTLLK